MRARGGAARWTCLAAENVHCAARVRALSPNEKEERFMRIMFQYNIDGTSYIDGGVANNVPVSRAVELGARQIFVLNVNSGSQARVLSRPHDFMMHGFVLARAQRFRRELEQYRQEATIVEMPTIEVGHVPFTSLSHSQRLIEAGHEGGMQFLSMLGTAKEISSGEAFRASDPPSTAADAETSA